jgi:hypothetical protein
MHFDMEAYIALGFLGITLAVTVGLFVFLLSRRSSK